MSKKAIVIFIYCCNYIVQNYQLIFFNYLSKMIKNLSKKEYFFILIISPLIVCVENLLPLVFVSKRDCKYMATFW